jgi:acetyl esterase
LACWRCSVLLPYTVIFTPVSARKCIDLVHANLANLPPTTIINAEIDPLRSEGELLATQLRAANVPVEQKTYSGVTHEFFSMGAAVGKAKDAMMMATTNLKQAFSASAEPAKAVKK